MTISAVEILANFSHEFHPWTILKNTLSRIIFWKRIRVKILLFHDFWYFCYFPWLFHDFPWPHIFPWLSLTFHDCGNPAGATPGHQIHQWTGNWGKDSHAWHKMTRRDNGSLKFAVYQKATHTDYYLQYNSHQPLQHKLGMILKLRPRSNTVIIETDLESHQHALHSGDNRAPH